MMMASRAHTHPIPRRLVCAHVAWFFYLRSTSSTVGARRPVMREGGYVATPPTVATDRSHRIPNVFNAFPPTGYGGYG